MSYSQHVNTTSTLTLFPSLYLLYLFVLFSLCSLWQTACSPGEGGVYPSAPGGGEGFPCEGFLCEGFLCEGLQSSFMVMVPRHCHTCSSAVYISNRGNGAAHWRPLQSISPVHTLDFTTPVVYLYDFAIVNRKLKCIYSEE